MTSKFRKLFSNFDLHCTSCHPLYSVCLFVQPLSGKWLDELVLLNVWWQRARPGCIHLLIIKGVKWLYLDTDSLRHINAGEGEEREREKKLGGLMNSLRAHCHVDPETLMLLPGHRVFLLWISVTFASDSQSHHRKCNEALKYYI